MERNDREEPRPGFPATDEDAPLDEGYTQAEHYGHNQESLQLRDPRDPEEAEAAAKPATRHPRRGGLGTSGAAGIPDATGHTHTGFGDPDRD